MMIVIMVFCEALISMNGLRLLSNNKIRRFFLKSINMILLIVIYD
jgi:hypothetical protein